MLYIFALSHVINRSNYDPHRFLGFLLLIYASESDATSRQLTQCSVNTYSILTHWDLNKMNTFCRRHFEIPFVMLILISFNLVPTIQMAWQWVSTGSNNGLRWRATAWNIIDKVLRHCTAPQCHDEWNKLPSSIYVSVGSTEQSFYELILIEFTWLQRGYRQLLDAFGNHLRALQSTESEKL